MDGTVNMKGSLRARCSCLTGSSRAASEDELPVGWGDVVAAVVDVVQDGWALFFDGDCDVCAACRSALSSRLRTT